MHSDQEKWLAIKESYVAMPKISMFFWLGMGWFAYWGPRIGFARLTQRAYEGTVGGTQ